GDYKPQSKAGDAESAQLAKVAPAERFAAIRDWKGRYGGFARGYLLRFSHYVLETSPKIAYDIASVDRAMEWGYAWELGPFRQMDLLGKEFLAKGFAQIGLSHPALLERATDGLYRHAGDEEMLSLDGAKAE